MWVELDWGALGPMICIKIDVFLKNSCEKIKLIMRKSAPKPMDLVLSWPENGHSDHFSHEHNILEGFLLIQNHQKNPNMRVDYFLFYYSLFSQHC
jgi:hypothetical protein